ncbi:hypothetical protein B2G71_18640 [Novosphingobium sp. PC22D]|uniref:hypothetical protein n=1 Tax=Novosphingobium sp. PC22D TaxID=1962403 RepID=UPI000BF0FF12|nr:hypothetical protein [Novosphingobium sp. PC22D]PEQ11064.1 hypothetical protein B2G71_18640 [Novosphingobium sp. PC22D]
MTRNGLTCACLVPVAWAAGASAAQARGENSVHELERARDFDLARSISARAMPRGDRERERVGREAPRFAEDPLGPRWSYRPTGEGPSFEVSALGAGRDSRAGLLNVGVDWQF